MHIGLIAMSGVRACDEELLRLGLTLPGFVERSKTIASLPSLGLLTFAGMTPAGHTVRYLEIDQVREVEEWPEFDLADAPMPAYELLDIDRYNRITVQTTRGCPFRCSF